ncbi:hypothetical protein ACWCPF_38075 [Streptomyces sp. NPDC001858]
MALRRSMKVAGAAICVCRGRYRLIDACGIEHRPALHGCGVDALRDDVQAHPESTAMAVRETATDRRSPTAGR